MQAKPTIAPHRYQTIAEPAGVSAFAACENAESKMGASHHSGRADRTVWSAAAQREQASELDQYARLCAHTEQKLELAYPLWRYCLPRSRNFPCFYLRQ